MTSTKQPPEPIDVPDLLRAGELQFEFLRASGPGGQNVNKVSTAVRLRFDLSASQLLSEDLKARLRKTAASKLTKDDVLVIEAQRYRTQLENREDALQRLAALLRRARKKPKKRRPTRRTAASEAKRLRKKRQRSEKKRRRRPVTGHGE